MPHKVDCYDVMNYKDKFIDIIKIDYHKVSKNDQCRFVDFIHHKEFND